MSRILELAKDQKQSLTLAAHAADLIRIGVWDAKEIRREQRWVRRRVGLAIEAERQMIELAFKRPDDTENFRNYDMVGAISNLTQSRVNRLAYFGRVLP